MLLLTMTFTSEEAAALIKSLTPCDTRAARTPPAAPQPAPLPKMPSRQIPVLLTRNEVSRMTGESAARIYAAFANGDLLPDAVTSNAAPLFALENLPALKSLLEKTNTTIAL